MNIETKIELVGNNEKRKIDVAAEADNFRKAKQNLERMTEARNQIVGLVKDELNLDVFGMEDDIVTRVIGVGGQAIAEVQAECRYEKTPYKSIVEGFESYLNGMKFLLNRGRTITGIRKQGNQGYVEAKKLITDLGIIVAGNVNAGIEYNINVKTNPPLPGKELIIPEGATKELSANSMDLYWLLQNAIPLEEKYVKAFNKESSKGVPKGKKRVTKTASGEVVVGKIATRDSVDYMDVVRSLVEVPMSNKSGKKWDAELPYLVDKEFNFKEKCELLPWYALMPKGRNKVYVGINSVYDRIQSLKTDTAKKFEIPEAKVQKVF